MENRSKLVDIEMLGSEVGNVGPSIGEKERICWGCGLRLLLPSNAHVFKCGWCGAITNERLLGHDHGGLWWRRWRDRCFVFIVCSFMSLIICAGVWSVCPVIFSISNFWGIFHSGITLILAVTTFTTYSRAAFRCAGTQPDVQWGSYPLVGRGDLEDFTFCSSCSKAKSPRTHHCRSCGMCILDMDHHCPFIGNCVGAANHRPFIGFLISTIVSTIYVAVMCGYAGLHTWPRLKLLNGVSLRNASAFHVIREIFLATLSSAFLMSTQDIVLVYLIIASISVQIGLVVLLWQQLLFIYKGQTYLSSLSLNGGDGAKESDCRNILSFFGCPNAFSRYLSISRKRHKW
ncbi:hypothetical protein MLD38_025528 [Melastoma candidum]|uniref:Uncharacterized protein n=1 Tax=Melastoma candidum TaxID=119954 RepID=A0ACB9NW45_9MYRT|nr:hypothetical protein MLD38_025528 [Melastoma candidum]